MVISTLPLLLVSISKIFERRIGAQKNFAPILYKVYRVYRVYTFFGQCRFRLMWQGKSAIFFCLKRWHKI